MSAGDAINFFELYGRMVKFSKECK
jgi:hypothetical protein